MARRSKNFKWNKHLTILLVSLTLAMLIAVGSVSYAAYTNSQNAQRVVAPYDTYGEKFSSNYLNQNNSRDNVRTIYVTDSSIHPSTIVTVCNYEQGKQTLPYKSDITYSVTVRLVKFDDSTTEKYVPVDASYMTANSLTGYSVTVTKGGTTVTLNSSHLSDNSFSGTLTSSVTSSDAYALSFSTGFASNKPNLYLEMIVVPAGNILPTLRGVFKCDLRAQGATNAWTGMFNDDTSTAPSGYDGYNYIITGTGSGTCTIQWDDTKVALSYVSQIALLSITGATQTGNSISFPVDSDEESRYDLQFYKVNITSETWTNMNSSVVTFTFGG